MAFETDYDLVKEDLGPDGGWQAAKTDPVVMDGRGRSLHGKTQPQGSEFCDGTL